MKDNNEFIGHFGAALVKISREDNLGNLENIFKTYISNKFTASDYISFVTALNELLGEHAGPILLYLHNRQIVVDTHKERQALARINNLRTIYGQLILEAQMKISRPFSHRGFSIGGEQGKENFYYLFTRRDGQEFAFDLVYNEALQVAVQIVKGLSDRIDMGNNNVDLQLYEMFRESFRELDSKIEILKGEIKE